MNALAGTMIAALANSLGVAVLIVLLAFVLLRLAKNANAATRHVVWWAVFCAVLSIAPVRALVNWARVAEPAIELTAAAEPHHTPLDFSASVSPPAAMSADPVTPPRQEGWNAGYLPLAVVVLGALVFLVQLARVIWSYLYLRALKSSGTAPPADLKLSFDEWLIGCAVKRPVRLLLSDRVQSPIAVGFRHPAVIIPRSMVGRLSTDDIDHLLLHELAHLARRDDWTNLLARLAWGLVIFFPVMAWILRRIDEEREVACDDWVVWTTGEAKSYAISLSRLIEFRLAKPHEMLATGIGGRRSQFGDRIERLLKSTRFDTRASAGRVALAALLLTGLLAVGTQIPSWVAFAQEVPPVPPIAPAATAPAAAPSPAASVAALQASPPARPVWKKVPSPAAHPAPEPPQPVFAGDPPEPAAPQPPLAGGQPKPAMVASLMSPQPPPPPPARGPAPPPPPPVKVPAKGPSFLQGLADAGYRDLTVEEIIELKNNGVSPQYLAEMNQAGWGRLTARQLIDLRNNGLKADYLKGMKEAGFKDLTLADVTELRRHGVRPDVAREIHALGFGPYDVKQVVALCNNGVRPDFFAALKETGFAQADFREIIEAQRHGLNASSLREAKKYGGQLTLPQIIKLKQAGVI